MNHVHLVVLRLCMCVAATSVQLVWLILNLLAKVHHLLGTATFCVDVFLMCCSTPPVPLGCHDILYNIIDNIHIVIFWCSLVFSWSFLVIFC